METGTVMTFKNHRYLSAIHHIIKSLSEKNITVLDEISFGPNCLPVSSNSRDTVEESLLIETVPCLFAIISPYYKEYCDSHLLDTLNPFSIFELFMISSFGLKWLQSSNISIGKFESSDTLLQQWRSLLFILHNQHMYTLTESSYGSISSSQNGYSPVSSIVGESYLRMVDLSVNRALQLLGSVHRYESIDASMYYNLNELIDYLIQSLHEDCFVRPSNDQYHSLANACISCLEKISSASNNEQVHSVLNDHKTVQGHTLTRISQLSVALCKKLPEISSNVSFESFQRLHNSIIEAIQHLSLIILQQNLRRQYADEMTNICNLPSEIVTTQPSPRPVTTSRSNLVSRTRNLSRPTASTNRMIQLNTKPTDKTRRRAGKSLDRGVSRSSSDTQINSKSAANKSSETKATLTSSSSSKLLATHVGFIANTQWMHQLCKTGDIQSLLSMLLHQRSATRMRAYKCMEVIVQYQSEILARIQEEAVHDLNQNMKLNISKAYDLMASCLEQGLMVFAEVISRGISLSKHQTYDQTTLFPEKVIRDLLNQYFILCIRYIETSKDFRTRILDTFVYSANHQLRLNILSGIICLCQSMEGKRLGDIITRHMIQSPSTSSDMLFASSGISGKERRAFDARNPIRIVLSSMLLKDANQAKSFLQLIYFLSQRLPHDISPDKLPKTVDWPTRDSRENESMVWIRDNDVNVKMLCPNVRSIRPHSDVIADVMVPIKADENATEDEVCVLEGRYTLWQEIFSQMTHEYLFESSVSCLVDSDLIEAFRLCYRYEANILCSKYLPILIQRLSFDNIETMLHMLSWCVQDFIKIARGSTSAKDCIYRIAIHLLVNALSFISGNSHELMSMSCWKTGTMKSDLVLLVECLFLNLNST